MSLLQNCNIYQSKQDLQRRPIFLFESGYNYILEEIGYRDNVESKIIISTEDYEEYVIIAFYLIIDCLLNCRN